MMTKNMVLPLFTNQVLNHKPLSPEHQQEQANKLQPFYERLISLTFHDSTTAIEHCRDLCAEYGFTVKQEASTHRNIYVYCSREGLADSLRNPKSNPQRRRPSKRCDCRWRVVLFETNGHWEFRKSLNPEASKHNHELMDPSEIERSWPKEVTNLIFELARQRLTTQEVRTRVQTQFPGIHWNERRFYNRLSEERQKIKLRDSAKRTHQLNGIWGKLCMAAAGNDDLSKIVEQQLNMLFQSVCETVQVDPHFFPEPTVNNTNYRNSTETFQSSSSSSPSSLASTDRNRKQPKYETHKGYLPVEVPSQIYHVKIHSQRQLQETQILRNQKRHRTFSEESILDLPNRYPKIKSRHSPLISPTSSNSNIKSPSNYSMPTPSLDYSNNNVPLTPVSTQPVNDLTQNSFVYAYDNQLSLDPIQNYVPQQAASFQNTNFSMTTSPTTSNGFNAQDISLEFNTSSSLVRNTASTSSPPHQDSIYSVLQETGSVLKPKATISSSNSSSATSPTDRTNMNHSSFYSLQKHDNKTSCDSLQPSQLRVSHPNYPSKSDILTKSPVMNESYQRQMMFIPPPPHTTARPF